MSTQQTQQDNTIGSSISSSIFSCICMVVIIGIIFSIVKYIMAASAMSRGDYGAAAAIMTEGRPVYSSPARSTGRSLFSINL
ncbi:hypothetical protein QKU48_gp0736 [Fadolivirus algeromassiliense]|jgi:hypothetical protein|uniref:Uncharacterized protein n=1 Tax=Fadolivirus FV1/VV64 TaxID=3070911 RepID=A0A7D3UVP0_9VIRU|nr:hypothetical protein QKU48_gp0736 [Fadolivirus algeromassiliense]QKF94194.1 hypothetical protein Fadolivirus_1_736 [Fadolivirus FV1/VV64]